MTSDHSMVWRVNELVRGKGMCGGLVVKGAEGGKKKKPDSHRDEKARKQPKVHLVWGKKEKEGKTIWKWREKS